MMPYAASNQTDCREARSQDFVQEAANLARAQGTPYQRLKTPGIWPTIFWVRASSFFIFTIKFYCLAQGEYSPRAPSPWLRPWLSHKL